MRLRSIIFWIGGILVGLIGLDLLFPPPLERANVQSAMVFDRDGRPLRAFPISGGHWRFGADLDRIDPRFIDALINVEDKRFYEHWGVDPLALTRASFDVATTGRIDSGASTITMQAARLLEPRPRTLPSKLIEMVRAVQIERRLSKREILELYLTMTPYGGNIEGVEAASWAWLGRAPDALSDDQIAFLIAMPQSPEVRRPDRRPRQAMAGRDIVAEKLVRGGFFTAEQRDDVASAPAPRRHDFPAQAWHASANARRAGEGSFVTSTLDAALQQDLTALIRQRLERLPEPVQMSAIVVDIPTRSVRAHIGSGIRSRPGGWIDLSRAARSPGSALKPFIYGLSFDDGTSHPQTKVSDLPKRFSSYQPDNFDRTFRGDVTISEALQYSLNVPAVQILNNVGPGRFAAELRHAGANPRIYGSANATPGLALALGSAGLTLQELAVLYAALGDGGVAKPLRWVEDDEPTPSGHRLLSEDSAADIIDILKRAPAPAGRIPARLSKDAPEVAAKTGTSYGYRDAWAAGVAGRYAIIVWVGRADGGPRIGETGRKAALPILFEIADRTVARLGAGAARSTRLHKRNYDPMGASQDSYGQDAPPQILFPPAKAELWASNDLEEPSRPFVFAGQSNSKLDWYVDGQPIARDDGGLPAWKPEAGGFYNVTAVDEIGRSTSVSVRIVMNETL